MDWIRSLTGSSEQDWRFCGCEDQKSQYNPYVPPLRKTKYLSDVSASIAVDTRKQDGSSENDSVAIPVRFSWLIEVDHSKLVKDNPVANPYIEAVFPDGNSGEDINIGPNGNVETKENAGFFRVPFVPLNQKTDNSTTRYYAISPLLDKRLKCGLYHINATVYRDKFRSEIISRHRTKVLSRVDSKYCTREKFMHTMKGLTSS